MRTKKGSILKDLPDLVTVLGVKFRIEVPDKLHDEDGGYLCGETIGETRLIKINGEQDTRRRWTTLLHEVVHAILHVNGLGNVLDEDIEEVIAQSIEHGLEEFFLQYGKEYVEALSVQKYVEGEGHIAKQREVQK